MGLFLWWGLIRQALTDYGKDISAKLREFVIKL